MGDKIKKGGCDNFAHHRFYILSRYRILFPGIPNQDWII